MLTQFLRDEEGQTTVEYMLIIMVIVVVIAALGKGMKKQIEDLVNNVFKGVNAQVSNLMQAGTGK